MTVAELIAALQGLAPETRVVVNDAEGESVTASEACFRNASDFDCIKIRDDLHFGDPIVVIR